MKISLGPKISLSRVRNFTQHIGMRIRDRVAFGSSLWLRFARCVARSVIVVAGKVASILTCGLDYSSCVTHSHNPFCVFAFLVVRDFSG